MKRIRYYYAVLLVLFILPGMILTVNAQTGGNKKVITEVREVPSFNKIDAGSTLNVLIKSGEIQSVKVETDENLQELVMTEVRENTLFISSRSVKSYTRLNIYVTASRLQGINAHGGSHITSEDTIRSEMFEIIASGASEMQLEVDVQTLRSEISGAATVALSGDAVNHSTEVSGAGKLKAFDLVTQKTDAGISGAGTAYVHAEKELIGEVSGAGDLLYREEPVSRNVFKSSVISHSKPDAGEDTTSVKVVGVDVYVIEKKDTVEVHVGDRVLIVDEDGNVKYRRKYKHKYNGHWAGFDIGLNGYVDQNGRMNFPKEIEYMELRMEKSVVVNINFFEQNIALSKNQRVGFTTGLGMTSLNYRFMKTTHLNSDSSNIIGYLSQGVSVRKSKLSTWHLTLPVLFEWQTNRWCRKNSFHVGGGMIMNVRLWSWTKIYYNEQYKDFELTRYNPNTGNYEVEFLATSPGIPKVHDYDDWFLRPFKFDATLRIGWGWINLWATYSVNTLFRDDRGPVLYPWGVGITLINL